MRPWLLLLAVALLAACLAQTGHAEPFRPGQVLDQEQVAQVTAAALAFMAPRILDPVPIAQLTLWGLRGLTTLDPRLSPQLEDGSLRLVLADSQAARLLLSRPQPAQNDADGWAAAAAATMRAGWDASQSVRRARTSGLIQTFFDELFNHLDPYSRYVPPAEAAAEQAGDAELPGIGVQVAGWGQSVIIAQVQPDSAAAAAGLRPGQAVLAVDGEAVAGDDPQSVQDSLAGPQDSLVTLSVRAHGGRARSVRLVRRILSSGTVVPSRRGAALVVRISSFAADTGPLLAQALRRSLAGAGRRGVRGVVLDLRDNRGGVLEQAAAAAQTLLPAGIVATTAGRDPAAAHVFRADGEDLSDGLPVIVLVDGRSASAAEILAAGLADQRRAVVVGSATLGKGLVQTILPLPDGGALYVTWSRVLAPLGWPIQGLGVLPQVCTALGAAAAMRQLEALREGRQTMAAALARERAARAPISAAEALDLRAACPAALGRDLDLRTAQFLIAHPQAYQAALLGPESGAAPGSP